MIECEDDCLAKKHRFSVWARTLFNMNQVKGLQLATSRGAGAEMRRAVYFCSFWLATNHYQRCHDMKPSYLVSCFCFIYIYIYLIIINNNNHHHHHHPQVAPCCRKFQAFIDSTARH